MKLRKIHASEWAWLGSKFDTVLDNNHTISELYKQAEDLVVGNKISLPPDSAIFA